MFDIFIYIRAEQFSIEQCKKSPIFPTENVGLKKRDIENKTHNINTEGN